MAANEFLITSSQTSQQFSACLWDYNTLNVNKYYKDGGGIASKCLEVVGQDYILGAALSKPHLYVWPLNSQDQAKNIRLILPDVATCLTLCSQNIYLAVGINCKLYIWQLSSGKLLTVQQKNYQPISSIKYSSDGEYLLVGGQDGILIAYNFSELISVSNQFMTQNDIGQVEPLYTKNDHSMPILDIHVGNFGRKSRFATVSADQTCRIYNLSDGEMLLSLVFDEILSAVIFDAPCWQLFVGTSSGIIRQFNLKEPPRTLSHHVSAKNKLTFAGHNKKINCLALNTYGTVLASGSEDCFVYIWDIKSRQIMRKIDHKSPITNIKFVNRYANFFVENLKPHVILKSLERNLDLSNESFTIAQIQSEDINLSDDENSLEKETSRQELLSDNKKLRIVNRQLYNAALEISKKYNLDK